jgi:hypothetical protein
MLMKYVVFWGITRRRVVIVYRRFGTTYRSHPRGSRVLVGLLTRNTPEDRTFHFRPACDTVSFEGFPFMAP